MCVRGRERERERERERGEKSFEVRLFFQKTRNFRPRKIDVLNPSKVKGT